MLSLECCNDTGPISFLKIKVKIALIIILKSSEFSFKNI